METINVPQQFAHRLRQAMMNAGFNSHRSPTGVDIHQLTKITGYSIQICRKYLKGEVIPEPGKLIEIAHALGVSPGWLLFGDAHNVAHRPTDEICINKSMLHYVFKKAVTLYNGKLSQEELPDFLMELIQDVSLINADEAQTQKIIDLVIASAQHFTDVHGT